MTSGSPSAKSRSTRAARRVSTASALRNTSSLKLPRSSPATTASCTRGTRGAPAATAAVRTAPAWTQVPLRKGAGGKRASDPCPV